MKKARMTICLMAAVLLMATNQGFGTVYFNDGGTHNISSTINDTVWVDYHSPGMQTTVNLLNGGRISSYNLEGFSDSRINISGGSVGNYLNALENSQVTMSDGSVKTLEAFDNSQVTIYGGTVSWELNARENGRVTMSGGLVGNVLFAYDNSQVTISGGSMNSGLYAYGSSQVIMSGGSTNNGNLLASYNSCVTMSGGLVRGDLFARKNSQVTMSGGVVSDYLSAGETATLTIYGSNFAIDGSSVGFGVITSMLGGDYGNEPYRRLTGTLANGDIINNQFQIGNDAKIVLVPEPTMLLLLGLGAVMLRRRK